MNNQFEIISLPERKRENSFMLKRGSEFDEQDEKILISQIKEFLLESRELYPGIDSWWQGVVIPGIRTGERVCYAARVKGYIAAVSIGKRARRSAKLCTLRVHDAFRGFGLGERLLKLTIDELLRTNCQRVHYTISENVFSQCGSFFKPYGFSLISWKKERYTRGIEELVFAASSRRLTQRTNSSNRSRDTRNWNLCSAQRCDALLELSDRVKHDFSACQQPKLLRDFCFEKHSSVDLLAILAAKRAGSSWATKTRV